MTRPITMRAVTAPQPGGPEALTIAQHPVPAPGPEDVLIEVAAAGVNRPDIMQRQGLYPPPPGVTDILGLEVTGVIRACGDAVTRWKVGDSVCALVSGGGYAEYCVAPGAQCLPIPDGLDYIQAASLPEAFFTVWSNLQDRARLRKRDIFLVHGGTSGIGTAAIQIANSQDAVVFATAGTDDKCQACQELGAKRAVNYHKEDFVSVIKKETDNHGADVILDIVGGDYMARNIRCLAKEGRLVNIAYQNGSRMEIDFLPVMLKRLTITGSTLRIRETVYKANIAQDLEKIIWPRLVDQSIRPVVHAHFPLTAVSSAHAELERGDHIGKIVLTTTTT